MTRFYYDTVSSSYGSATWQRAWYRSAGLSSAAAYDLHGALNRVRWAPAGNVEIICECCLTLGDVFAHLLPDESRAVRAMIAAHLLFRGTNVFFAVVGGAATPEYLMQFANDPLEPLGLEFNWNQ